MPVVNISTFVGTRGMPIGISVLASRYFDRELLRICNVLSKPLMAEGDWRMESDVSQASPMASNAFHVERFHLKDQRSRSPPQSVRQNYVIRYT